MQLMSRLSVIQDGQLPNIRFAINRARIAKNSLITDFWTATGQVDFKLLKYLFENKVEEYIDDIFTEYQQAKQKGATVH